MPMHRKSLLFIDDALPESQMADYFNKFNFNIVSIKSLSELETTCEVPVALLISATLLEANPAKIHQIYERFNVPLIVISNQVNEKLCVNMLEAGADDFLVKPIHPRELHARIGAISRRVARANQNAEAEKEVLLFSEWRLYPASRQVFSNDHHELLLSAGEYDLLHAFVRQPQQVLGREFLLQITKHSDLHPFDRRIDVQISRLRQKIELDAKKPALIKTIRNGGYLFTAPVEVLKESVESH
ncbi:DNA-binding response regulator [Legionella quinlivanii]|uniref:DNA-binding response regulator n=1 Tax=Legionella quinlivanii TaxID=45073 RepID=A0A0W0XY59_9GAMM|nr:DNA-binding response regulator [Legionella quinlivanii]SEG30173.1 DNA-binding response regulator, OmpR family, contains REC and winged-helix (wHTH) domain [Legionella quinlivanii DSM 21216]STY09858.1 DNA-binding response regulator [Legionella quinlivanii]